MISWWATYNSTIMDPMKAYCRKLTTVAIEAGHWVALEQPDQTNAAMLGWIAKEITGGEGMAFREERTR